MRRGGVASGVSTSLPPNRMRAEVSEGTVAGSVRAVVIRARVPAGMASPMSGAMGKRRMAEAAAVMGRMMPIVMQRGVTNEVGVVVETEEEHTRKQPRIVVEAAVVDPWIDHHDRTRVGRERNALLARRHGIEERADQDIAETYLGHPYEVLGRERDTDVVLLDEA